MEINWYNKMIHKIRNYIPNEKILFQKHPHTKNLEIIFLKNNNKMTVLKESTWNEIKRHIDIKKNTYKSDNKCPICFEKNNNMLVTCTKCANFYCRDCYINIFRQHNGIIICPYCRWEYGKKIPNNMIEYYIDEIKKK